MKLKLLFTLALLFATMQTFAQSPKTKYEYDTNNRLAKVTYSNGTTVTYTYDKLGNRLSKKTVKGNQGQATEVEKIQKTAVEDGLYYNLSGQRVNKPVKGVYIKNGTKTVVK